MDDPILDLRNEITDLRENNKKLDEELYNLRQFVYALQFLSEAGKDQPSEESQEHVHWWLDHILDQTLRLLEAPEGSLLLLDPASKQLEFKIVRGISTDLIGKRLPMGEGIAGWVATHAEACVVLNVADDERFSGRLDSESGFETRSIVAAPLLGHGKVIGVVEILNQAGEEPFTELHRAMLGVFCDLAGEALARVQAGE